MKLTIELAVTPVVKKYLDVKVGKNYHLGVEDWFGGMIINMLENKNTKHYTLLNKDPHLKTESFVFTVGMSTAQKNGFVILPKHEVLINSIVDDMFRKEIYIQAITNKKNYMIEYQTTIANTLDYYDITDEEMTYDTIKRDFSRKRAGLEERLFL